MLTAPSGLVGKKVIAAEPAIKIIKDTKFHSWIVVGMGDVNDMGGGGDKNKDGNRELTTIVVFPSFFKVSTTCKLTCCNFPLLLQCP